MSKESKALAVKRDEQGRLTPGGAMLNPRGRPKGSQNRAGALTRYIQAKVPLETIVDTWKGCLQDRDAHVRARAAQFLAEWGYQKPAMVVETVDTTAVEEVYDVSRLTDAELEVWEALAAKARRDPEPDAIDAEVIP
jgi:hypothetical protein